MTPTAFNSRNPCPLCGRVDRCSRTEDGLHLCKTHINPDAPPAGWRFLGTSKDGNWGLFRAEGDTYQRASVDPEEARKRRKAEQWDNFTVWRAGVGRDLTSCRGKKPCYERLRVMIPYISNNTFDELAPVFVPGETCNNPIHAAIGFPEVNGDGDTIGVAFRYPNAFKQAAGSRGITVPARLAKWTPDKPVPHRTVHFGPLFVVEGASDVLAMTEMGLDAIGRPSNVGGAEELAEWIVKHVPRWRWDIVVMGENDRKEDGSHPGLDGAQRIAAKLAELLDVAVRYAMPPSGSKDVRDWYVQQVKAHNWSPGSCGHTWLQIVPRRGVCVRPGENPALDPTPDTLAAWEAVLDAVEAVAKKTAPALHEKRAAEAKAAEAVAAARANHDREHGMRCERPRAVVLHDLVTNGPRVQYLRCEDYVACPGCRRWRIFREAANATLRFHQHAADGQLWELYVSAEQWSAMRRRINRLGGQYLRTHEDCDGSLFYVVTSVHVPNSIAVRPDVAASTVRTLLNDYDRQPRPVATSHGWKLPQVEERVDRYRRVGMASRWTTRGLLREIADALGCGLTVRASEDVQSRSVAAYDLVLASWSDEDRDYAFDCLMAGEVLTRWHPDLQLTFSKGEPLQPVTTGPACR